MKNSIQKLSGILAVALAASFTLAGCGGKDTKTGGAAATPAANTQTAAPAKPAAKKIKLRFAHSWGPSDSKGKFFDPMLKDFIEKNKDRAEIEVESSSGDELKTKIKVDTAAGNTPDFFTFWGGNSVLKPLVDGNVTLDIEEYLKESKQLKKEQISEGAWSYYTIKGKIYGIPMEGYRSSFLVNKKLFEKFNLKYPKTYEELKTVAQTFNSNGIIPLAIGSKSGNPSHFWFSELYSQFDKGVEEIKDMEKSWKFNTENSLKVAKLIEDMRKSGMYPKDTVANGDWAPSFALYNEQKAAMCYTYPWMLGQMKPEIQESTELIPVPKMPGGVKDPATFVNGSAVYGMVINRESFKNQDKKPVMIDFVDYITSDKMFLELSKGGLVPTKKVQLDKSSLSPILNKMYDYSDKLEHVPTHHTTMPDANAFTTFKNTLDELFIGAVTPEQFVDKVQKSLDKAKQ